MESSQSVGLNTEFIWKLEKETELKRVFRTGDDKTLNPAVNVFRLSFDEELQAWEKVSKQDVVRLETWKSIFHFSQILLTS